MTDTIPADTKTRQDLFITKYIENYGVVTETAQLINLDRDTYYKWRSKYPSFIEDIKEADAQILRNLQEHDQKTVPEIEKALEKTATGGDTRAIEFYLKNRKPDRWKTDSILNNQLINNGQINLQIIRQELNTLPESALKREVDTITARIANIRNMSDGGDNVVDVDVVPNDSEV